MMSKSAVLNDEDVKVLRQLLVEEMRGLSEADRKLVPEDLTIVRQILLARKLRRRLGAPPKRDAPKQPRTVADLVKLGKQIAKQRQRTPEGHWPEAWGERE